MKAGLKCYPKNGIYLRELSKRISESQINSMSKARVIVKR